ncbi:MAG: hypothetical protein ACFE0I_02565 [Elainellaceae cyanobacterium]
MADITAAFSNFLYPGTKVVERTDGYRVVEIPSHSTTYMFGSAEQGNTLDSTQVTNSTDFTNVFGASPSEDSVKLYFDNHREGILYFIRTPIAPEYLVVVDATTASDYTVDINGTQVTYTKDVADTVDDVASGLITEINASIVADSVTAVSSSNSDELRIRSDDPDASLTVSVSAGDLTASDNTPTNPVAEDYSYAIQNTFDVDEGWEQGFIIAPEAFQRLTDASDRLAVGNALEQIAAAFDFAALIDCGEDDDTVSEIQSDGQQYTTSLGHLGYYAPYLLNLSDSKVPPSAAVAAVAGLKYGTLGYPEPIGGTRHRLKGVKDVVKRFNNQQQSTLNPLGINLIRNLRNKGVVIWGMRTRADDPNYRFLHTRVIMNVLNGALREGFDQFPFSSVDGKGILLHRIEETAASICRRMWADGAFFGQTEDEAFQVICNFTNNSDDNMEAGNFLLEVYAATAPGIEKLLIASVRVPIGQVEAAANRGAV